MNGKGKGENEISPLEDNEEKATRDQISNSQNLRRSLGQSFIGGTKGSFFTCVTGVYSSNVGAGALSLPILVSKFGFIIGVILIMLCGWLAVAACQLLQRGRVLCGLSEFFFLLQMFLSLRSLTVHCFKKAGDIIVRLVVILFCLGMTIAYLIVMCTTIDKIIETAYDRPHTSFFSYKYFYAVAFVIIVSPFAFAKSMERLKFVSYINITSSFIYFIISIIGAAKTVHNHKTHKLFIGPPSNFKIEEALMAFGCIFVAYAWHLSNPSDGKMMGVCWVGIGAVCTLYSVTACTAYVTFGGVINGDVLNNYKSDTVGEAGYYVLLICYGALTLCGMPMLFFGGRDAFLYTILDFWDLIRKKKPVNADNQQLLDDPESEKPQTSQREMSKKYFYIATSLTYAACCLIGILVTDLEIVMSILGCVCGNTIAYILPGAVVWYLESQSKCYKYSGCAMVVFGIVSMIISLVGVIWNEIKG